MWILFFLFLVAEPKGKPKSLIHDARFAILRRPLSSIHVRFKGRYSRDAEWIFEFASLPIRFPNFLCAVILSFFDSHIGCCRYAMLYDWYIDIYIWRVLSSSIRISWYESVYRSFDSARFVSLSISLFFLFFPFFLFLQKVFSRENPSSRKLNRVISFDQVVTQLRSN